ncbi:MAG: S24/S26 family peptidase [Chloroflexi bacterium]|nr:S24/S26 family peptidase [Chloroflexota bacterium]MBU1660267.1 S24/S26 family peptidase [Chloroflexota bacterium]
MSSSNPPILEATLKVWAETGRHNLIPVKGTSMYPSLRPGDVTLIVHGYEKFRAGDILVYRSGDQVVIHRFLRWLPDGTLLMAGDNRQFVDTPIPVSAVLGRVISVITPSGQFSLETCGVRAFGRMLVTCFPFRGRRGLRRVLAWLFALAAWILRR